MNAKKAEALIRDAWGRIRESHADSRVVDISDSGMAFNTVAVCLKFRKYETLDVIEREVQRVCDALDEWKGNTSEDLWNSTIISGGEENVWARIYIETAPERDD